MSVLLALALAAAPGNGCAGPRPGWLVLGSRPSNVRLNRITLSGRDRILWNGAPVARQILRQYLDFVAVTEPLALTVLVSRPDTACALVEAIRDDVETALPCAARACGEGTGAWTEDLRPSPPPPPPSPRRPQNSDR